MSFLTPWSLLWLLPLGGVIILLYLLRLRRVPRLVASVMLWERLVADIQANAPFQRLRKNLLLFLQLLALLILVLALARPFVVARGYEGQSIVLVMDCSASMRSTDVAGSRFAQAQRLALQAVGDLGRGDTMAVVAAGAGTRVAAPFTSDHRQLVAALRALPCTDSTTHLEDALRLADSLCARRRSAQIVIISDGAFRPLAASLQSSAKLSFQHVGRRLDNAAITTMGARRSLAGAAGYAVYVGLSNFSAQPRRFTLELSYEGQLLDAREQHLRAGGAAAEVFELPPGRAGLVTAAIDAKDDLAADNTASVVLAGQRRCKVLLLSKGDLFLERALALDPSLDVSEATAPPAGGGPWDVVVVEGLPADHLPAARGYLYLGTGGGHCPVVPGGKIANPTVLDWARDHPVTRYLDLSGLRISAGRAATLQSWGRALAEGDAGPLLAAGERGGVRSVYVGWDLLHSDFPLRVAFPIFLANCFDWLAGAGQGGQGEAVRVGEAVTLPPPAGGALQVTDPAGGRYEYEPGSAGQVVVQPALAGVYTAEAKGYRRRFAASVLSREESGTPPARQVSLGGRPLAAQAGAVRTNREVWRWLAVAALAVLLLEWAAYHKRP